jgi:hypothetical protein
MRNAVIMLMLLLAGAGQAAAQGLPGANGTRSFTWPNGDSFVGEFHGGLPNGAGTMRYASGQLVSGLWVDGCLKVGSQRHAVFTTLKSCPRGSPVPLPTLADR